MVLELLTWAGLLRLLVSCWVLSNPSVFDYQSIYETYSSSYSTLAQDNSSGYLPAWIESRLIRTNVFPLVVFIIVIVFFRLFIFVYHLNPLRVVWSYFRCVFYLCRRNKIYSQDSSRKLRAFDLVNAGILLELIHQ